MRLMGSHSEEDEQFFDTKECITPVSDSGSDCADNSDSESRVFGDVIQNFGYEIWIRSPGTIDERRHKLFKLMGLAPTPIDSADSEGSHGSEVEIDSDRMMENSGAVLRSSFIELHSPSQSCVSCCFSDIQESLERPLDENLIRRIRNLDDGSEFIVDELGQDGILRRLREVGSNRLVSGEEFERILGFSPLVQQVMRRDYRQAHDCLEGKKKANKGWLKRLGVLAHVSSMRGPVNRIEATAPRAGTHNVRVRTYRKRTKEFSALYMKQDIIGHDGAILTMKFSPDGKLLASAGEDGIVRVWQVIESERSDSIHFSDMDPSNVYFIMNHLSELAPVSVDKEKRGKLKSLRKSSESACVIFPRKVFQIAERPLHAFRGHMGEVLDLSWSENKYLLSSSVDRTVRLWQMGFNQCLRVFSHNNYVTCVQFNPSDENYFISGSIDGKVRIWAVPGCEVVDWTDVKEIVTAVCYQPDGKGAIVGSMNGDCFFYDTSDNRLEMIARTSLPSKKKASFRRITGLQFSPVDPSKLMVTTADSQVRILQGVDVICKYRGLRNAGSQISASFTSDGTHIVSASEDSFIYVWNCAHPDESASSRPKTTWSYERFFSNNASVAIPWCGGTSPCSEIFSGFSPSPKNSGILVRYPSENLQVNHSSGENSQSRMPLFSSEAFSLGISELFSRGSATWPEDKLPMSRSLVVSSRTCKSEYRFLKTTCQNMVGSPHSWGLVIVTAGWDGRIRVFQNYGLPVRL